MPNYNAIVSTAISKQLMPLGFDAHRLDKSRLYCRRLIGEGLYLAVTWDISKCDENNVEWCGDLFIQSQYIADVGSLLGIDTCAQLDPSDFSRWQTVASVSLIWLLLNGEPPKQKTKWHSSWTQFDEAMTEWKEDFVCYGSPFIRRMGNPEAVAYWIEHLDAIPHSTRHGLERHFHAFEYAAILNHYLGHLEALRPLLDRDQEMQRSWLGRQPQALATAQLRYQRLIAFITDTSASRKEWLEAKQNTYRSEARRCLSERPAFWTVS